MRIRALLITAAATVAIAGCGNSEPATAPDDGVTTTTPTTAAGPDLSKETFVDLTGEAAVEVQAHDNTFIKPYIEVSAGTKVTFANKGRNQHNVVPVDDGAFEQIPVEDFQPKDSGTVTFTTPGDYAYYCSLHGTKTKGMVGAIRVLE